MGSAKKLKIYFTEFRNINNPHGNVQWVGLATETSD